MTRAEYGTGSIYQRKDGRWVAAYKAGWSRDGVRRRRTVTGKGCPGGCAAKCPHRREIKRKLRDLVRQMEDADTRTGPDSRVTVKAWMEKWLDIAERGVRPSTHTTDKAAAKWIVQSLGHRRLADLDADDVRALTVALRKAGRSTSTAKRYHGTLSRALGAAVADGHRIAPSVMAAERPEANVHDRTTMTTDQALTALERASHLPHGSRWAMAFLQGLRQGEALGLTRDAIDFDRNVLKIEWQLQPLPYLDKHDRTKGFRMPDHYEARRLTGGYHLVRPKTRKGFRVIPLVPWARDALEDWLTRTPENPWGLVWPTADGMPRSRIVDTNEWQELQSREPVIVHPSGRPYHVHEIRNTTATLLLELGVEESVRIAIMGHSSIAVTRGYEYVDVEQSRAALIRVGERLGNWRALPG